MVRVRAGCSGEAARGLYQPHLPTPVHTSTSADLAWRGLERADPPAAVRVLEFAAQLARTFTTKPTQGDHLEDVTALMEEAADIELRMHAAMRKLIVDAGGDFGGLSLGVPQPHKPIAQALRPLRFGNGGRAALVPKAQGVEPWGQSQRWCRVRLCAT